MRFASDLLMGLGRSTSPAGQLDDGDQELLVPPGILPVVVLPAALEIQNVHDTTIIHRTSIVFNHFNVLLASSPDTTTTVLHLAKALWGFHINVLHDADFIGAPNLSDGLELRFTRPGGQSIIFCRMRTVQNAHQMATLNFQVLNQEEDVRLEMKLAATGVGQRRRGSADGILNRLT